MLNKTDTSNVVVNEKLRNEQFVQWFRKVAPYVHKHRDTTMVIHLSGELLQSENLESTIHDIALLKSLGIRLAITFGARPQIEQALLEQNINSEYVEGLRVTDHASLTAIQQVVGALQIKLQALLSMNLPNSPMSDARLQVSSGNYVTAKPAGVIAGTDLQFTGVVRRIDIAAIKNQMSQGDIVIIPPIGYSITGELFDLSALDVASKLAMELSANKLLFLFPFAGIKDKHDNLLRQLTQLEAENILTDFGDTYTSPYAELHHAIMACRSSVERVHLIDQRIEGGLLQELFSRDGIGTLISQSPFDTIRKAESDDIAGILELIEPQKQEGILVSRSRERMELEIEDYTVMDRDGTVIACAALHYYPKQKVAELACLVVHDEYQQQKKGQELFLQLEQEAKSKNIERLFTLTTRAEHWFIERGFTESNISDLPIERQKLYNYSRNSKVYIKQF